MKNKIETHDLTPAQQARLDRAMDKINLITDGRGHFIDDGIAPAVAMLNYFGLNTSQSCEGHGNWATRAPYIDIEAKEHDEMSENFKEKIASRQFKNEDLMKMSSEIWEINRMECKKVIPILDDFYKGREVSYENRIGLSTYDKGITRLESVGAKFQEFEPDQQVKLKNLKNFQAEMSAFSDFLIRYEPKASLVNEQQKKSESGVSNLGGRLMDLFRSKSPSKDEDSHNAMRPG